MERVFIIRHMPLRPLDSIVECYMHNNSNALESDAIFFLSILWTPRHSKLVSRFLREILICKKKYSPTFL